MFHFQIGFLRGRINVSSTFSSEVRDSLLLFLSLTGLLQSFWLVSVRFNLFVNYYPIGFVVHFIVYLTEIALLMVYVKIIKKSSFQELGFRKVDGWKSYAAVGLAFALFHNIIVIAVSITLIGLEYDYILPLYVHLPAYFAFAWIITIPEEGIFRGCVLRQLLRKYSTTMALIISSIFFGLYHIYYIPLVFSKDPIGILFQASYAFHAFTSGLFLGYLYHKTGRNLLAPMIYHFSSIYFNVPFKWTEATTITQIVAQQLSSAINFGQILFLRLFLKEKHE
jgi:membrane protease YdiL (CAAX protease family)